MATLNWRDWFKKEVIKEVVKYDPYYFTPSAEQYREEIRHLQRLLRQAEEARAIAEKAARQNLYPDPEFERALKALRIMRRVKMEMDTWTAS
jgi:hypothetical protein